MERNNGNPPSEVLIALCMNAAAMRRSTTGQVVELADGQHVVVSRLLLPELRRRLAQSYRWAYHALMPQTF